MPGWPGANQTRRSPITPRWIRLTPGLAGAHLNLGYAWDKKGEPEKAIAEYDEAIRLDPADTQAYINRGFTWLRMGEPDKAIADEDMVIRLDPKSRAGHNNRGNALAYKGEFDKAIADYDVAIRLDPKSPLAYHNRGNTLRNKGEIDNAIADYDASLQINASQDGVLMDRGLAWFAKSDYAHAQDDFAEAARLKPKFAYYAILVEIARRRVRPAPTNCRRQWLSLTWMHGPPRSFACFWARRPRPRFWLPQRTRRLAKWPASDARRISILPNMRSVRGERRRPSVCCVRRVRFARRPTLSGSRFPSNSGGLASRPERLPRSLLWRPT